eukprot:TRINITY_DN91112_c0_g1_i1.p1 TRINITY_DN91112_c0_g1~~TRINITY_DN91112_c0_g1_i1.p1  ORF type:complete len:590 (-),score=86.59 TRINITY_DN91112_c0_g1_i1:243-2012(-)
MASVSKSRSQAISVDAIDLAAAAVADCFASQSSDTFSRTRCRSDSDSSVGPYGPVRRRYPEPPNVAVSLVIRKKGEARAQAELSELKLQVAEMSRDLRRHTALLHGFVKEPSGHGIATDPMRWPRGGLDRGLARPPAAAIDSRRCQLATAASKMSEVACIGGDSTNVTSCKTPPRASAPLPVPLVRPPPRHLRNQDDRGQAIAVCARQKVALQMLEKFPSKQSREGDQPDQLLAPDRDFDNRAIHMQSPNLCEADASSSLPTRASSAGKVQERGAARWTAATRYAFGLSLSMGCVLLAFLLPCCWPGFATQGVLLQEDTFQSEQKGGCFLLTVAGTSGRMVGCGGRLAVKAVGQVSISLLQLLEQLRVSSEAVGSALRGFSTLILLAVAIACAVGRRRCFRDYVTACDVVSKAGLHPARSPLRDPDALLGMEDACRAANAEFIPLQDGTGDLDKRGYVVRDAKLGDELLRSVLISCPGVSENGVEVLYDARALVVTFRRAAMHAGLPEKTWSLKFWQPELDWDLELQRHAATLRAGILTLTFLCKKAKAQQTFRFPCHYSLCEDDFEDNWELAFDRAGTKLMSLDRAMS